MKLYKIINGGHDWPGAFGNMDIHSAEKIWIFLEQNLQAEFIGDVNFDHTIDIQDLLRISDYLSSENPYYFLYDFDENHNLSGLDIISIIDYIFEKLRSLYLINTKSPAFPFCSYQFISWYKYYRK